MRQRRRGREKERMCGDVGAVDAVSFCVLVLYATALLLRTRILTQMVLPASHPPYYPQPAPLSSLILFMHASNADKADRTMFRALLWTVC